MSGDYTGGDNTRIITVPKYRIVSLKCWVNFAEMNRHHFAIYLRNCKLEMLMRAEAEHVNRKTFIPAEWRWRLPEVCDNKWHHYTINMNFPEVELISKN